MSGKRNASLPRIILIHISNNTIGNIVVMYLSMWRSRKNRPSGCDAMQRSFHACSLAHLLARCAMLLLLLLLLLLSSSLAAMESLRGARSSYLASHPSAKSSVNVTQRVYERKKEAPRHAKQKRERTKERKRQKMMKGETAKEMKCSCCVV
ncbi:hypothetical protein IWZ03DRAFT_96632 [Phyllosticta citriasiana]|uniref:Transmembrane protein n=1 Tax=Phyllosticta citriasiana TaxID=595635 RepID=A0ABR1KV67_9PEZI